MSYTPRTNAFIKAVKDESWRIRLDDLGHYMEMTERLSVFARQLERELATNSELLSILQNHNYRHESATDTLKRIILERNALQAALKVARANP